VYTFTFTVSPALANAVAIVSSGQLEHWLVTMTVENDSEKFKANQRIKYLCQR